MKKFFIIFLCGMATLSAERRVAGSSNDVDLILEDKYSEEGHDYGDDFYAHNKGDKAVRFVIRLIESFNAANRLTENTIIIEPGDAAFLGSVEQNDRHQEANWSYEWQVKAD